MYQDEQGRVDVSMVTPDGPRAFAICAWIQGRAICSALKIMLPKKAWRSENKMMSCQT